MSFLAIRTFRSQSVLFHTHVSNDLSLKGMNNNSVCVLCTVVAKCEVFVASALRESLGTRLAISIAE